jgi:hypothetical protein
MTIIEAVEVVVTFPEAPMLEPVASVVAFDKSPTITVLYESTTITMLYESTPITAFCEPGSTHSGAATHSAPRAAAVTAGH